MKSGLLLIDKPTDMNSTWVGSRIKRILGVKKVGHVGTLDPFASGLLPMAIGRATAVVRYMDDFDKRYLVRCRLGKSTTTLDGSGVTTKVKKPNGADLDALLKNDAGVIRAALRAMEGELLQTPPLYSAVKVAGKRLYDYAYQGAEAPAIPSRSVQIKHALLLDYGVDALTDTEAPLYLDLDIACSKGTYIRSFCADLGERLGFPAYAEQLRRSEVGPFNVKEAIALEQLSTDTPLLALEAALTDFPVLKCSLADIDRLLCGLSLPASDYAEQMAAYGQTAKPYLMTSELGVAGVCRLRPTDEGRFILVVERMFSDRDSYFTR